MNSRPQLIALADEIRRRRLALALTAVELADKAGLHRQTVKALEAQNTSVQPGTIRKLANAFGCAPSDISQVEMVEEVAS